MRKPLRALIIEDSEGDTELILRELARGYVISHRRVDSARTLNEAIDHQEWDIVLADYILPGFSGAEALAILSKRGLDMPFIFVSGTMGEDAAVMALKAGAQDYITKGNLKRLFSAVNRELREAKSRRRQRRSEEESRLLNTIVQSVSETGDVNAAIEVMLDKLCEIADWALAQVWIPNAAGTQLGCDPAYRCPNGNLEKLRATSMNDAVSLGEDLPGKAWLSQQTVYLPDVARAPDFLRADMADAFAIDLAAVAVPVLADTEVIAVFELFGRPSHIPDDHSIQFVSAAAKQFGGVLQRKRAERRLQYLAYYDALTGLPNRVSFNDCLARALADADRHERLVGLIFIDLDRFKDVNDSLGHRTGDRILQAIADRIRQCVRQGDTLSRLAGDEFTLILSDMKHADDAVRVAQGILDKLDQPFYVDGHELSINVSLGITIYPFDENDMEGLLRNADIAMYRAKERGGNSYEFYSAEMAFKVQTRLALEKSLRRAMERDEFELHYQPIVDLGNGRIQGVEALIRWRRPGNGLLLPDEFISVAEETGLSAAIGEWALRTACRQCHQGNFGGRDFQLMVNVSSRQFAKGRFCDVVIRALEETGFDPRRLCIEITEDLLMRNAAVAAEIMRNLGNPGVHFSIDDFGSGYSNLRQMQRLPIEHIKIDGSFVSGAPGNDGDGAIVSAVIALAHTLGFKVIAEGVETADQLEFLRAQGCDAVQGHYCSPPVPHDTITEYLGENRVLLDR